MLLHPRTIPCFDTTPSEHGASSWSELGLRDFDAFWRALHDSACPATVLAVADTMFSGWGGGEPVASSSWRSQVSDDGTPWEFSVCHRPGAMDVRLLVEAQGDRPCWDAFVAAGLELTARLFAHGADLDRFERVRELFLPRDGDGCFALWHGATFERTGRPLFKLYLNPQIHGCYHAPAVVEQAFAALGLRSAFPAVLAASHRACEIDEIRYVSIDLDRSATARVKVYLVHEHVGADQLERVMALALDHRPGRARELCELIGGGQSAFTDLPISTCLSFVAGHDRPTSVTAHLPVRAYAQDDAEVRTRIAGWLATCGFDPASYLRAIAAVAHRPLDAGLGLHSYASTKAGSEPTCTVYVGSEACRTAKPRPSESRGGATLACRPATEIVAWAEQLDFRNHPFFRRLEQTSDVVDPLYRLALNMRLGIAHRFTSWLAALISRVPDVAVRSILAHQLDDELGRGRPEDAHVHMFERMFAAVEAKATPLPDAIDALAPARRFAVAVEPYFVSEDPWAGVGLAALAEIAAAQTDEVIARVFRRQHAVAHGELGWAFVHDELERAHAQDSDSIVRRIPDEPELHAAMWRGARAGAHALWLLLDDLYPLCFDR
jgi:DMATS type aromatic prenyltransferase